VSLRATFAARRDSVAARRDLVGRVVLVTGGSAGIGRATATCLAERGADVVVCARGKQRLEEAAREMPGALAVVADTTSADDRERLVGAAVAAYGRLDAVVLNAGQGWVGLVEDMPVADVERLVAVNLTATMALAQVALPHLLASAAARAAGADIVVVSSVAAWSQVPPLTVYCATKAGVQGFVRGLRREVAARGVRVSSVNPGPVRTEWLARGHGHPPRSDADAHGRLSVGIPPSRVARAVTDCLRSPWSRSASVPRVLGLARLGEVPPVDRVLDLALSRMPDRVRAYADAVSAPRAAPQGEARLG
jgi:NAD(P)-dependent dehydrogenase (short-subunit alcohol dehydrogenase family)